eukprot:g9066.t1
MATLIAKGNDGVLDNDTADREFSNNILKAKYKVRPNRNPNDWPKIDPADEHIYQPFECSFPTMFVVEEANTMTDEEFQTNIEKTSTPTVLRGLMNDWRCFKKCRNELENEHEWTLEKICDRHFTGNNNFQCGIDIEGEDVNVNLRQYMKKYVYSCFDRNPMLIFDAVIMENEECDLNLDFTCPTLFSQDDYLKHIDHLSRPPFQWFIYGPKNSGSPCHTDVSTIHELLLKKERKTLLTL